MSIELTVHGEPSACREAAGQIDDVKTTLDDVASTLAGCRSRAAGSWEGPAALGFMMTVGDLVNGADEVGGKLSDVSTALTTFAGTLAQVKAAMADARTTAAGGGCTISGDTILRPDDLGEGASPTAVDAHNAKVAAYNRAFTTAQDARTDEARAHEALTSALDGATGDGVIADLLQDLGFAPKGDGFVFMVGQGAALLGLSVGSYASWVTMGRLARYQPTWGLLGGGNHMPRSAYAGDSAFRSWLRRSNLGNYTAAEGMSSTRRFWSTAGEWTARAGAAVEGGVSAYEQWQSDADNPALNGSERVARAGTVGVSTGLGAYGGAVAGAQIGAAIGSVFPGPGTAIGGVAGGIIGGIAGSKAGEAIGDFVKDEVGAAAHWAQDQAVAGWNATTQAAGEAWDTTTEAAGEAWDTTTEAANQAWDTTTEVAGDAWNTASKTAGDLAEGAGDLLAGAGDVASDVGDKLTFWD
jgi:uncharacterized protein YukE